jgi:hypothetical protein
MAAFSPLISAERDFGEKRFSSDHNKHVSGENSGLSSYDSARLSTAVVARKAQTVHR